MHIRVAAPAQIKVSQVKGEGGGWGFAWFSLLLDGILGFGLLIGWKVEVQYRSLQLLLKCLIEGC